MDRQDYLDYITAHQADYDAWFAARPADTASVIRRAIHNAQDFANRIRDDFVVSNVIGGITAEQVAQLSDLLAKVNLLLDSGSMQTAYAEMFKVPTDVSPFWTVTRRDALAARIMNYLQGKES